MAQPLAHATPRSRRRCAGQRVSVVPCCPCAEPAASTPRTSQFQVSRRTTAPKSWFAADGDGLKRTLDAALGPNVVGAAVRAAQPLTRLLDAKGGHAGLKVLPDITVA